MRNKTNGNKTRNKILRVSEKVFAEKGFDAARVDYIAKKASVNKALIYYYFGSKELLLEALLKENAKEIIESLESNYERVIKGNKGLVLDFYTTIISHLKKKKNVLKIIMYEMLNSSKKKPKIFDILDLTFDSLIRLVEKSGYIIKDIDTYRLRHFFYHFIPSMGFILIGDKYCNQYGISIEQSFEKFVETFSGLKLWES